MRGQKACPIYGFKALDDGQGIFEAIVAVFNNVDRGGDKILPGAFTKSLEAWEAKGRPIPVIFSHDWGNLDAHIGEVLEAKEVEEGLYVKGQLEMDEPFAKRVWKKMKKGTLAEFSFAYDIIAGGEAKEDGNWIYELKELDLLEVGPCLVGMNPDTQLLGVKEGRRNSSNDASRIQQIHDLTIELGAKCAVSEDSTEDDTASYGKSSGMGPSTIAARIALDLLGIEID